MMISNLATLPFLITQVMSMKQKTISCGRSVGGSRDPPFNDRFPNRWNSKVQTTNVVISALINSEKYSIEVDPLTIYMISSVARKTKRHQTTIFVNYEGSEPPKLFHNATKRITIN